MRVLVNLDNILKYELDKISGNSRADLLAAAARAEEEGQELYVQIPDAMGGDTEAPVERNTFEHFADLPEPDGRMHEQQSMNLAKQVPTISRTKLRITRESLQEIKDLAMKGDGLTEEEWEYWVARAVEIVESPYGA